MATVNRDQRLVTVEVTKAELASLLGGPAKTAGFIDFDPDNITVQEVDPVAGTFHVIFEKEGI